MVGLFSLPSIPHHAGGAELYKLWRDQAGMKSRHWSEQLKAMAAREVFKVEACSWGKLLQPPPLRQRPANLLASFSASLESLKRHASSGDKRESGVASTLMSGVLNVTYASRELLMQKNMGHLLPATAAAAATAAGSSAGKLPPSGCM